MIRFFVILSFACLVLGGLLYVLSRGETPAKITYGVTFSAPYAREIGINWKKAYRALLDDLKVRHLRLPAYWSEIELKRNRFVWDELDFQIEEAAKRHADIIVGVGRRLPRWPECHTPEWAKALS